MTDQNVTAVFRDLALQMSNSSSALGAQGIAQVVSHTKGTQKSLNHG